jgi:hypothetical protein
MVRAIVKGVSFFLFVVATVFSSSSVFAEQPGEVKKGQIPAECLASSFKELSWGVKVWDSADFIKAVDSSMPGLLIVDTRPKSFFDSGSIVGAVNLAFDMSDSQAPATESTLSKESLTKAIQAAGISPDKAVVAFFCQGPECHRSYNASLVAVKQWGFSPANIIWFRSGYPGLIETVKSDALLKRKAGKYFTNVEAVE